jgi:hypothetical protein
VLGPTTCLRYAFLVAVDMLAYGAAIRHRAHAQESCGASSSSSRLPGHR